MPAINFIKAFVPKVISGKKPHTIRAMRKRRFRVGDRLYFYTGQRTQYCRKIGEYDCLRVDHIRIWADYQEVIINGQKINMHEIEELAKRDGFQNRLDFFKFFKEKHGDDFEGQLIWWKNT